VSREASDWVYRGGPDGGPLPLPSSDQVPEEVVRLILTIMAERADENGVVEISDDELAVELALRLGTT